MGKGKHPLAASAAPWGLAAALGGIAKAAQTLQAAAAPVLASGGGPEAPPGGRTYPGGRPRRRSAKGSAFRHQAALAVAPASSLLVRWMCTLAHGGERPAAATASAMLAAPRPEARGRSFGVGARCGRCAARLRAGIPTARAGRWRRFLRVAVCPLNHRPTFVVHAPRRACSRWRKMLMRLSNCDA